MLHRLASRLKRDAVKGRAKVKASRLGPRQRSENLSDLDMHDQETALPARRQVRWRGQLFRVSDFSAETMPNDRRRESVVSGAEIAERWLHEEAFKHRWTSLNVFEQEKQWQVKIEYKVRHEGVVILDEDEKDKTTVINLKPLAVLRKP